MTMEDKVYTENARLKQQLEEAKSIASELPHKVAGCYGGPVHEHPDRCLRCRLEEALNG